MHMHFTFFKKNLDGTLSHRENLNNNELDAFLIENYGRFANILIRRSCGAEVHYTDNGVQWEVTHKSRK